MYSFCREIKLSWRIFMSKKHTILMLLCCVVGMGAAAAILVFGIPVNRVFTTLLILLCPVSHLLMMKFMMKDGHNHGASEQSTQESHLAHTPPAKEKPVIDA
jgi:hypothetical protein